MKFTQAIAMALATMPSAFPMVSSFLVPPSSSALLLPNNSRASFSLFESTTNDIDTTSSSSNEATSVSTATATATSETTTKPRPTMPTHSPATKLQNQIYNWRNYQIRYQVSGPENADHTLLLIHGLFVNSDHWRKTLTGLHTLSQEIASGEEKKEGSATSSVDYKTCRVYAIDLLGSGWSSKPNRDDVNARLISGENGRFSDCDSTCYRELKSGPDTTTTKTKTNLRKVRSNAILANVPLGTPAGGKRSASALELRHPLRSPYNFYTWAEQIADFTHDVIHADYSRATTATSTPPKVTLVANSIGTMSSLQSILDEPSLFNGCFVINPNFRELHSAEVPFSGLTMPLVRQIQSLLRTKGHGLFTSLATKETVSKILQEPYAVIDAIDDELVDVLLTPLLTEGADDVVFDTLSYSAGPLPEQQLGSRNFPIKDCPVWVVYGKDDPWTPPKRVENLKDVGGYGKSISGGGGTFGGPVEKIVGLEGVGHCPHDESPEVVNKLILEFLDRLSPQK